MARTLVAMLALVLLAACGQVKDVDDGRRPPMELLDPRTGTTSPDLAPMPTPGTSWDTDPPSSIGTTTTACARYPDVPYVEHLECILGGSS